MSKDLWFAAYEQRLTEFEDTHGRYPTDTETDRLSERASWDARERLADMIDDARDRAKEGL